MHWNDARFPDWVLLMKKKFKPNIALIVTQVAVILLFVETIFFGI